MSEEIRGYKVFNEDWTCRGKQYSCPGVFKEDVKVQLCKSGMHFCRCLSNCFHYYPLNPTIHVAEVIALGEITLGKIEIALDKISVTPFKEWETKVCTDKLEIVREIPFEEVIDILNKEYNGSHPPIEQISNKISEKRFLEAQQCFKDIKANKYNIMLFTDLLNNVFSSEISMDNTKIYLNLLPEYNSVEFYFENTTSNLLRSLIVRCANSFFSEDDISLLYLLSHIKSYSMIEDSVYKYFEIIKRAFLRSLINY